MATKKNETPPVSEAYSKPVSSRTRAGVRKAKAIASGVRNSSPITQPAPRPRRTASTNDARHRAPPFGRWPLDRLRNECAKQGITRCEKSTRKVMANRLKKRAAEKAAVEKAAADEARAENARAERAGAEEAAGHQTAAEEAVADENAVDRAGTDSGPPRASPEKDGQTSQNKISQSQLKILDKQRAKTSEALTWGYENRLARLPQLLITYDDMEPVTLHQTDVEGDGNCFFRAFAFAFYGSEDAWKRAHDITMDWYDTIADRSSRYSQDRRSLYGVLNRDPGEPVPQGLSPDTGSPINLCRLSDINSQLHRLEAWADGRMIQIMADAFDVEIIFYTIEGLNAQGEPEWQIQSRGNADLIRHDGTRRRQIHLFNYGNQQHWTAGRLEDTDRFSHHLVISNDDGQQLHRYPIVHEPASVHDMSEPQRLERGNSLERTDSEQAELLQASGHPSEPAGEAASSSTTVQPIGNVPRTWEQGFQEYNGNGRSQAVNHHGTSYSARLGSSLISPANTRGHLSGNRSHVRPDAPGEATDDIRRDPGENDAQYEYSEDELDY